MTLFKIEMFHYRLLLVGILAALLSACGGKTKNTDFFGVEEKAKKPKIETITKIKRNWRVDLGKEIRNGDAVISPAVLGDYVYAASPAGRVEKLDIATGKRVWRAKLKDTTISAGVGVGNGLVLVGTSEGKVFALNQEDGSVDWSVQLDSEVLASPVAGGSVIVARSADGKVYGIASFDGSRKWTISRQLPKLTLRGDSRPVVTQGVVFAGFSDGYMAALEAETGRALWDFPISFPRGTNEIDRLADIDTDPLLVGEYLYISSYQKVTHALNIAAQKLDWSVDISSFNPLAYDAAFLYISDRDGVVHQVDRTSGEKQWSQQGLRLFNVSAPASVGPYVVVNEGDGGLYVIQKSDGRIVGKHRLGAERIVGEPTVEGNTLVFLDSDGAIQSITIQGEE